MSTGTPEVTLTELEKLQKELEAEQAALKAKYEEKLNKLRKVETVKTAFVAFLNEHGYATAKELLAAITPKTPKVPKAPKAPAVGGGTSLTGKGRKKDYGEAEEKKVKELKAANSTLSGKKLYEKYKIAQKESTEPKLKKLSYQQVLKIING